jgi:PTS system galactitol-specific IIC component
MQAITNFINFIMNCGPEVMLPLIIMFLGVLFRQKFSRVLRAGILTGIAFAGLNLVIGMLFDAVGPVVNALVEARNFSLTAIDLGWVPAAALSWSTPLAPIIVLAIFATNILLLLLGWTKTLDVDIWNYWMAMFNASATYMVTKSAFLAVIGACINMGLMFIIADKSQPLLEEYYGYEGITIPHLSGGAYLFALPLNWVFEHIPIIKDIKITSEGIQERFGVFGEPALMGTVVGMLLAVLAKSPAEVILRTGIAVGATMVLMPRMISLLMEGLMPISEGIEEFVSRRFPGREIYIGLDMALLIGEPSVLASSLILIPLTLLLAVILPGNTTLPLGDLASTPFIMAWPIAIARGNIFRGLAVGLILTIVFLYMSTAIAPLMTDMARQVGMEIPEGATQITSYGTTFSCYPWITYVLSDLAFKVFGR